MIKSNRKPIQQKKEPTQDKLSQLLKRPHLSCQRKEKKVIQEVDFSNILNCSNKKKNCSTLIPTFEINNYSQAGASTFYLPPHLCSTQILRNVFAAECPMWNVTSPSWKKYDYEQMYAQSEKRYQFRNEKYRKVKSKIKKQIKEDRDLNPRKKNKFQFINCEHSDLEDLSEDSN